MIAPVETPERCEVCEREGKEARRCRFGAPKLCPCWRGVPCGVKPAAVTP